MAGRNQLLLKHRYFSQSAPAGTADIEFDESDVCGFQSQVNEPKEAPILIAKKVERRKLATMSVSVPVNVPAWSRMEDNYDDDDRSEDDSVAVVPPHEYLRRRMRGVVSFSVHEGVGRTLKGRDLSRVRNAVWGNVGFQD